MKGIFIFIDENKKEENISILKIPFKRDLIIEKSIEIYDESDPCIIYSTYCNQILGESLLKEINKIYKDVSILRFKYNEIPDFIRDKIEIDKKIKEIIIK